MPERPPAGEHHRGARGVAVDLTTSTDSPDYRNVITLRGTLADGREFDSSHKRGQPASFPLNRVIKCWTEGVQKMKVGGKAQLICPPEIAYGARGTPGGMVERYHMDLEASLYGGPVTRRVRIHHLLDAKRRGERWPRAVRHRRRG